jgi:cyclophilin family peptidyl-prolyl cis-trans isomerase
MSKWIYAAAFVVAFAVVGCADQTKEDVSSSPSTEHTVEKGEPTVIELELYPKKAPKTVERIVDFIESGFYNGQRFHRVESWVVQWGSPLSKTADLRDQSVGAGGSGKPNLPFETNDIKMQPGTLAMASTGAKVGGDSQMFILTSAVDSGQSEFLQGSYTAFGKVTKNMEAVDRIQIGDSLEMKILDKSPESIKVELKVTPFS